MIGHIFPDAGSAPALHGIHKRLFDFVEHQDPEKQRYEQKNDTVQQGAEFKIPGVENGMPKGFDYWGQGIGLDYPFVTFFIEKGKRIRHGSNVHEKLYCKCY
jgi:hypothetical protein